MESLIAIVICRGLWRPNRDDPLIAENPSADLDP